MSDTCLKAAREYILRSSPARQILITSSPGSPRTWPAIWEVGADWPNQGNPGCVSSNHLDKTNRRCHQAKLTSLRASTM